MQIMIFKFKPVAFSFLSVSSLATCLSLSSYSFSGPSTQATNFTIAFQTNSSDPTSIDVRLHHESGQEELLASNVNTKPKFVVLNQPFDRFQNGEQGRLRLTDVSNTKVLATTALFKVDDTGNVSAIKSKIPVLTNTSPSATPSASSGGLSTDAKIGIGVGAAISVLLLIGVGLLFFLRERRKRRNAENKLPPSYADPKSDAPEEQSVDITRYSSPTDPFSSERSPLDKDDDNPILGYRQPYQVELAADGLETGGSSVDHLARQGAMVGKLDSRGMEAPNAADMARIRNEGQRFELMGNSVNFSSDRNRSYDTNTSKAMKGEVKNENRNRIEEPASNEYRVDV